MTVSVFPASLKVSRQNKLENITLRGFGGGWNAVETDLQMESTYLVTVRNFRRTPGGTQKIRYGSKWLADLAQSDPAIGTTPAYTAQGGRILDQIYFSASIINVLSTGVVVAIYGDGSKEVLWNATIAAALPGAPAGWSSGLETISFVPYKNELIIHNGVDKPITISRDLVVTYLQDLGTGSNVNVPIGKYGCVVSNYHCIAGVSVDPSTGDPLPSPTFVYVSAVGTAGTFPGDPAPNDCNLSGRWCLRSTRRNRD